MRARCIDEWGRRLLREGQVYEVKENVGHSLTLLVFIPGRGWLVCPKGLFKIVSGDTEGARKNTKEDKVMSKKSGDDYSFHVSSVHQIDIQKIQDTLSLGKPIAILSSEKKPKQVFVVISPQIYWKIWKCGIPGPAAVEHESFLRCREQKWVPHRDLREIVERVRMIAKTPWREDTMKGRIDVTHVYS